MLTKIKDLFFGDFNKKFLNSLTPLVDKILAEEETLQKLSEEELKNKTHFFQERIKKGESLDDLLVEAYAVLYNACRRLTEKKHTFTLGLNETTWDMIPFPVQILGGIILHQGKIAEMKTGEGKTLVSCFPLYLNALSKKGCHLVTVNDYLAERDAKWMGQVFNYLGLSVGVIKHGQNPEEKKEAYNCDITYGTNNEFGFDYLRDNMAVDEKNLAMRDLNFAIVDEVDSILIDEARTPLIISAPDSESTNKYKEYAKIIEYLKVNDDYKIDEKEKTVKITEEGIKKLENIMNVENIYTEKGFETVHHLEASLKAKALFKKDTDYVVNNDEILIVDEFTGRLMPGRRFSGGLHQALEAKENVPIKRESKTLASITFQNFFRLYNKLSGMTGTAKTEAKEFAEIYGLDTIVVPTNKPIQRKDKPDAVFKSANGKYLALQSRIKNAYEKGQPVLIGTVSIEKSEILSNFLQKANVPHNVLNAKQHSREAEIIKNAGQKGSVTIATNMAGRGTDIKLSPEAKELGGLLVIGTERHESRRIDNQLRGRSGRQGDLGESQFYVSMDDDVLRLFGSEKMKNMMNAMGVPDDMPIENTIISRSIESAQKKVEVRNFEIRKHILQYDDVMNKHRTIIYGIRNKILRSKNIKTDILDLIKKYVKKIIDNHLLNIPKLDRNYQELKKSLSYLLELETINNKNLEDFKKDDELKEWVIDNFLEAYQKKEEEVEFLEMLRMAEKAIYLKNLDTFWMEHIDEMTRLRETVSLRAFANKNPLFEYKNEAFLTFSKMLYQISVQTIKDLFRVKLVNEINLERVAPSLKELQTNEDDILSNVKNKQTQKHIVTNTQPEEITKVGRNELCPCGSGKKYKKCCGK